MRLVKPSVEIFDEVSQDGILKHLERIARGCYKSEDRITEDSASDFISGIVRRGHEAMIEHYHFVFGVKKRGLMESLKSLDSEYMKFINITSDGIISGNARAFKEAFKANTFNYGLELILHNMKKFCPALFQDINLSKMEKDEDLLDFLEPEYINRLTKESRMIHKYITAKFICDRGVTHELVRHRIASYAQESTRFCCYSKEKFGNEVSFILPCWFKEDWPERINYEEVFSVANSKDIEAEWIFDMLYAENAYKCKILKGWTPQQARSVLPNSLKTEIVITANLKEIEHIIKLRDANEAHPQMRECMGIFKPKIIGLFN